MAFRSAILGTGGRAHGHVDAYKLITRGEVVALCDVDPQRLAAFGDKWGIAARYTDLGEMLAKEKPDVVHVATNPTVRVSLMTALADAGVPGAIVEKPICIGADDYKALRALEARSETRFTVNHQLRHHPRILELLGRVQGGEIGEVRCLDASAVLPMAGQGVHVLDLMFAFNGYAAPKTVFGASSGYDDIGGYHPTARDAQSLITFTNGARAMLQAGAGAPRFFDGPTHMHKRIAVYGTHGFIHWRMNGWERSLPDGTVERGEQDYSAEDIRGQANLTEALFDWIEDDAKVAPTNLKTSLDEWLVILAGYLSTLEKRPVDMPFDPPDDLLEQFRGFVGA